MCLSKCHWRVTSILIIQYMYLSRTPAPQQITSWHLGKTKSYPGMALRKKVAWQRTCYLKCKVRFCPPSWVKVCYVSVCRQGMAFSLKERQILGIHGLLPPAVTTQQQQIARVLKNFRRYQNDLDKYVYMVSLQDRNSRLFYSVLTQHIEEMSPIVYTPTVGKACQRYGFIFRRPRCVCLFVTEIYQSIKQCFYNMFAAKPIFS